MTIRKKKAMTSEVMKTQVLSKKTGKVIHFPRRDDFLYIAERPTPKRVKQEVGCSFPEVDLKEWCDKWDLEVKSRDCPECNRTVFTTIPFETKEYKGITTPDCKCGYEVRRAVCHVYCKDFEQELETVFSKINKLNLNNIS